MSAERLVACAEALTMRLGERSVGELDDDGLLELLDDIGRLRRELDVVGATAAAEVEDRSLCIRLAERTAVDVVALRSGIDIREARDWCIVGAAITPRHALTGEPLPPEHPAVADGLAAGNLTLGRAAHVLRAAGRLAPHTDRVQLEKIEAALVAVAPTLTERELWSVARRALDHVDPDGSEPREDLLRARSGLQVTRTPDGMLRWVVTMYPEAAGYLTTALDARTAPRRQPRFVTDPDAVSGTGAEAEAEADAEDTRTLPQRRLDALTDLARESLQHDPGQVAGSPVTMVVTVELADLKAGLGAAEIAGVDEPISAATARRLAADAEIIPVVLGGASMPLDLGRSARLHSTAQRRALGVRDGGCVWTGCSAPPGWCEVAHVRSWLDGGATDLSNGVLLCRYHHRRLDHDGWSLSWSGEDLYLTPPGNVDAWRTPRRAGRVPRVA